MQFAGSITIDLDDFPNISGSGYLQASISGMKAEEDVAGSVIVLAKIIGTTPGDIIEKVESNFGKLPECFDDPTHYLYKILGLGQ
jgi:hypothetical protein